MADQSLRVTKRLREIQEHLDSIPLQSRLTLWTSVGEQRTVFFANLIKIDHKLSLIYLQLEKQVPEIEHSEYLYIRFSNTEGAARCRVSLSNATTLALEISEELILKERRKHRRVQFQKEDQKTVTLKLKTQQKAFQVLNASRSGMKLKMDFVSLEELQSSGGALLTNLGELPVSIQSHLIWSEEELCAIELSTDLTAEQFATFASLPRALNIPPDQFFNDQEYLATIQSNMSSIISRLEKRPKFASAMKTLKVNRDGNYLKTHIDLLCYVSCSVGRTLGWVTDHTIDKLIYVSYLHDLRYFERPELARIRNLDEFNAKKQDLSSEDQLTYLDGPAYSAMMAKDDEGNSLDVERILIQQKERPDGSGFPNGINFKQLFPLSCLFIISHEFVDYVYLNPDWTFKRFIAEAKSIYKGPYFIKILQAFEEIDQASSRY